MRKMRTDQTDGDSAAAAAVLKEEARAATLARRARWSVFVGLAAVILSGLLLVGFTMSQLTHLGIQPIPWLSEKRVMGWILGFAATAGFVAVGLAKGAMKPENTLDRSLALAGYIMGILALCATTMILTYLAIVYFQRVVRELKRGGTDGSRTDT